MPFDGSGAYSLPAGSTAVTGATVLASTHNTPIQDIASALGQLILRSGVAPMTGNLNLNTNKIVGLAAGADPGDAVRFDQTIAALDDTDGNFVVGDGSGFTVESGATARTSLGLGSAAVVDVGTSGSVIPKLDGANTWGAAQQFNGNVTVGPGTFAANGDATLGNDSGDTVVVKGTTVSSYIAGILNSADQTALRANILAGASVITSLAANDVVLVYDQTASDWKQITMQNFFRSGFDAVFGSTKGNILYRTSSNWAALAPP